MRQFGAGWALPFAGMRLSIALLPLLAPKLWHAHFGKIADVWSMAFLLLILASQAGVAMPSLFAYMVWSCAVLLPLFGLITLIFFA